MTKPDHAWAQEDEANPPCLWCDVAYWDLKAHSAPEARSSRSGSDQQRRVIPPGQPHCSKHCRMVLEGMRKLPGQREVFWHRQASWQVAGVDEAGRGAWAGPVVAAATVLDIPRLLQCSPQELALLRDSKELRSGQRELAYQLVQRIALFFAVGSVAAPRVDAVGVVAATIEAMSKALSSLPDAVDLAIIDGTLHLTEINTPQRSVLRAENAFYCVAAASIVAKCNRDAYMKSLQHNPEFKGYHFERHKGYGTQAHRDALSAHGISSEHRLSYKPLQRYRGSRSSP